MPLEMHHLQFQVVKVKQPFVTQDSGGKCTESDTCPLDAPNSYPARRESASNLVNIQVLVKALGTCLCAMLLTDTV